MKEKEKIERDLTEMKENEKWKKGEEEKYKEKEE